MSLYYHPSLGVRQIDDSLYAAWVAAGNPKSEQYTPITDPPDQYAIYDGEAWVYPPGYFSQAKLNAHARRSELRLAHQTGGFTYDGHHYASDREESIPLLLNCLIAAQMAMGAGPEAVAAFELALGDGWRSTDGVGRITTAEGILALHAAFVAHGAACDRRSQTLKAAIDAAQSQAELDAIDLESGWPEVGDAALPPFPV